MRVFGALAVGCLVMVTTTSARASDECGTATPIAALPFTTTVDTTTATEGVGDPGPSCNFAYSNTVWFTYTASRAITLLIDTLGSDYATTIGVYTDGCAATAELACGNDHDFDDRTQVLLPVAAGATIHVYVADESGGGGNLVFGVTQASVDATPPTSVRVAVSSGDPSPIGGGFSRFINAVALSGTDVAFSATTEGIFLNDGVSTTTVAMSGDPTPVGVGGTYSNLGRPAIGAGGTVAFFSTINGGSADAGIFVHSAGMTTPLILRGDPAPTGGTFGNIVSGLAISPNATLVAFIADTSLDGREALWLTGVAGPIFPIPLLVEGDTNPCGGVINQIGNAIPAMSINDSGLIAIDTRNSVADAILLGTLGWTPVACEGAPTPFGGTYGGFARNVRIGSGGDVAFQATVDVPGPNPRVMFLGNGGGTTVAAAPGDLATGGETILTFSTTAVADVSGTSDVTFTARTSTGDAILTRSAVATQATVVLSEGQTCPAGGVFVVLDSWLDVDSAGAAVIRGVCTGGNGVFAVPAGGGPPTTVALATDVTTAGAGFVFDEPTRAGTYAAFLGNRTAIYQVHCDAVTCDAPIAVAQPLVPAPGLSGETIATIDGELVAGQGKLIAFTAATEGAARRGAIFAVRSGVLELVGADGTTLPGTTTDLLTVSADFTSAVAAGTGADKRSVVFVADISDVGDPAAEHGVYLARNGVVTEVARNGQLAPNGEGYFDFIAPLVKGSKVFFRTETDFGTNCVVQKTGPAQTGLGCTGDTISTPVGTIFNAILTDAPALASRGPVVRAEVSNVSLDECLLGTSRSGPAPVACTGDPLPYGAVVEDFESFNKLAASRRRVVSYVNDESFEGSGLYAFSSRARARIATNDQTTPVGGVYSIFDARPSLFGKTVAFLADVDGGGTTQQAVFVARLRK